MCLQYSGKEITGTVLYMRLQYSGQEITGTVNVFAIHRHLFYNINQPVLIIFWSEPNLADNPCKLCNFLLCCQFSPEQFYRFTLLTQIHNTNSWKNVAKSLLLFYLGKKDILLKFFNNFCRSNTTNNPFLFFIYHAILIYISRVNYEEHSTKVDTVR